MVYLQLMNLGQDVELHIHIFEELKEILKDHWIEEPNLFDAVLVDIDGILVCFILHLKKFNDFLTSVIASDCSYLLKLI